MMASKEGSTTGRQRGENSNVALSPTNLSQVPGMQEGR